MRHDAKTPILQKLRENNVTISTILVGCNNLSDSIHAPVTIPSLLRPRSIYLATKSITNFDC
jgi:hypothetical protein